MQSLDYICLLILLPGFELSWNQEPNHGESAPLTGISLDTYPCDYRGERSLEEADPLGELLEVFTVGVFDECLSKAIKW